MVGDGGLGKKKKKTSKNLFICLFYLFCIKMGVHEVIRKDCLILEIFLYCCYSIVWIVLIVIEELQSGIGKFEKHYLLV